MIILRKALAFALLVVCATACVPPEQARLERDNREMSECRRLGYNPYSEGFANCRLQLRQIEAQEAQTRALRNRHHDHHDYAPLTEDYYKHCKVTNSGNTICKNW